MTSDDQVLAYQERQHTSQAGKAMENQRCLNILKRHRLYHVLAMCKPRHILVAFAICLLHISFALAREGDNNTPSASSGHRIAGGDMPLNLLEVEGRWVVTTNSGWHNSYLQVYDELQRKVSGRMDLPGAWYGLAYDNKRKLLLASSPDSLIYVITFDEGTFGNRRELALHQCSLTA